MKEPSLDSRYLYRGRIVTLRVDTVELPNGKTALREVVEHRPAVAIVAVEGDKVLLVRQFRKAVEGEMLEVPAGVMDKDEEPESCARRELEEETGYVAQRVERLGGFYPCPGYSGEYIHLYLATGLRATKQNADDDEFIEPRWVSLSQIPGLIASGEICDGKSIIGLLTFFQQGLAKC